MYRLIFMSIVAALVVPGAFGVTVSYYSSRDLAPNQLALNHALVAQGDDDLNGPNSKSMRFTVQNDEFGNPIYQSAQYVVRDGNGIPDGAEFAIIDYIYSTPGAPHRDALTFAYDYNRNALFFWNGTGACDSPGTLFVNKVECDEMGGTPPFVCFGSCNIDNANILRFAAHATVSRHMGPETEIPLRWEWFNSFRELNVTFDDPRLDRTMVDIFAEDGDMDGDGYTNLDEWQSVMRALSMTPHPSEPFRWPYIQGHTPSRAEKDLALGRYITYGLLTAGLDPDDPNPPVPPTLRVSSQSGGRWIEAAPGVPLSLFVTIENGVQPITYQWFKNGEAMSDAGRVSGSATANLSIAPQLESSDSGTYYCVITDSRVEKTQVQSAPIDILVVEEGSLPVGPVSVLLVLAGSVVLLGRRTLRAQ